MICDIIAAITTTAIYLLGSIAVVILPIALAALGRDGTARMAWAIRMAWQWAMEGKSRHLVGAVQERKKPVRMGKTLPAEKESSGRYERERFQLQTTTRMTEPSTLQHITSPGTDGGTL